MKREGQESLQLNQFIIIIMSRFCVLSCELTADPDISSCSSFSFCADVHPDHHPDHLSESQRVCISGDALHAEGVRHHLSSGAERSQTQAQLQSYRHCRHHVRKTGAERKRPAKRRGEDRALREHGDQQ